MHVLLDSVKRYFNLDSFILFNPDRGVPELFNYTLYRQGDRYDQNNTFV